MFANTIRGTARFGLLVLAAFPAALPQLTAQDPGKKEVETLVRAVRATLLEHVSGDPEALLVELDNQLSEAVEGERAPILVRLTILLQRLGRDVEAAHLMAELASLEGAYGDWARQQLADAQDPVQESGALGIPDQLRSLVFDDSNSAVNELRRLGSLAIPAIVQALEDPRPYRFTPSDMRRVLGLVIAYDDPRVAAALRNMLQSENPLVQIVAAEFVPRLAEPARAELGRRALESEASIVRLRGVEALIATGGIDEDVRDAAAGLLDDASVEVRSELAGLLRNVSGDVIPADDWLEELAQDGESRVHSEAIESWLLRRGPEESRRRIAFYDSLPLAQKKILFEEEIRDGAWDKQLVLHAVEFPQYYDWILGSVTDEDLASAPRFLRALLAYENQGSQFRALNVVQERRVRELIPDVLPMLSHRNSAVGERAFRAIRALEPELLLERAAELLEDSELDDWMVRLLVTHGRSEHVPLMVTALQRGLGVTELLRPLQMRSEVGNLDAVLDLVRIPETSPTPYWDNFVSTVERALERWFERGSILPALLRIREVDTDVAQWILTLVQEHATEREVPAVVQLLHDMREVESEPLSGSRMLDPLASSFIADRCVKILGAVGGERAMTTLRPLIGDPDLGDQSLRELLAMEDAPHREFLLEVLEKEELSFLMAPALEHPLTTEDDDLRGLAEERLVSWSSSIDPGARPWLERLPVEDRKRVCTAILERVPGGAVPSIALARTAVQLLGNEKDGAMVDTLALGLSHPDWRVRWDAVGALQKTFVKEAAAPLIEALKDDENRVVVEAQTALNRLSEYFDEKEKWEKRFGIKK